MTTLHLGDCLDKLKMLADNSVDSIVTDPPYGISFMNKKWDYDVPSVEIWKECLRVLKPSGHLLSFSGSRTYHRMAVRIEDAGFEIRDQIMWIYGTGFPKGKTQLKPAHEPIVMARKPGPLQPLNIDDCRIGYNNDKPNETGRWPSNLIFDEEAGKILDEQSGKSGTGKKKVGKDRKSFFRDDNEIFGGGTKTSQRIEDYGDKGGASRFFYCPKASKKDREDMNNHPTVKPTDLMLYLIKLVTPKGGHVLDPFMGSGSTGKAAVRGGFDFTGIEREEEYINIAKARIENELK